MKVKFLPSGEEHEIEFNETVLHLAQRVGLHIQSVCKGIPSCAECRVQISEGEHHVLPPSKKELDLIGTAHYVDMSRLACQLRCFGDLVVDLKEQMEKESRAQQKPKERFSRRDGETSRAVLGGILDNVVADDVEVSAEVADKVEVVHVDSVTGDPHLDRRDSFYGDFYTGKKKGGHPPSRKSNSRQGDRRPQNKNPKDQNAAKANASPGGAANTDRSSSNSQREPGSRPKRQRQRNRNRRGGNENKVSPVKTES